MPSPSFRMGTRTSKHYIVDADCERLSFSLRFESRELQSPRLSPFIPKGHASGEPLLEPRKRAHQIRLQFEHRPERVLFHFLHPSGCRPNGKLRDVELRRHLAPLER